MASTPDRGTSARASPGFAGPVGSAMCSRRVRSLRREAAHLASAAIVVPGPHSASSGRRTIVSTETALEQRREDRRVDLRPVKVRRRQHRDVGLLQRQRPFAGTLSCARRHRDGWTPPASCTAVVDAPRRTSSGGAAPPARVRGDALDTGLRRQGLDPLVDPIGAEREHAVGVRGGDGVAPVRRARGRTGRPAAGSPRAGPWGWPSSTAGRRRGTGRCAQSWDGGRGASPRPPSMSSNRSPRASPARRP